jgi:hypothetical protein
MLLDQTSLSALRELLAQAAPDASQTLIEQQPQLLPRFVAYYSQLQGLPRRVRRGLQWQFRRMRLMHQPVVRAAHPTRLQRKWQRSVAGVALLLTLCQAPALAATINVGGGCKLVDAITAANTDNAIGRCRAGRGADTIVLPANSTQTLTQANNQSYGPTGLPVVTSTITIAGNGSIIARSIAAGTPEFRILAVGTGGNLTLRQTTISGGRAPGEGRGGGVYRRSGRVTLIGCTISGNQAFVGGGVANAVAGTLTVTNSTIAGNIAIGSFGGGGVFNNGGVPNFDPGVLVVTNSTIFGNRAISSTTGAVGGGVRNDGIATLVNSTVTGNRVSFADGGGVANVFRGSLTVTNSTISGNIARDGGGVWASYQATTTLTTSTISRNTAGTLGGGVYNGSGRMTLTNSTIIGNSLTGAQSAGGGVFSAGRNGNVRSDVVLNRTLIAGNNAVIGDEIFQRDGGAVTANSSNLFGHSGVTTANALSGFILTGASDITATSDGARPTALASILYLNLTNNGGRTLTHALVPGSPAIDAVATSCPPPVKDQRGFPRPQDGNNDGTALCDIGAVELEL